VSIFLCGSQTVFDNVPIPDDVVVGDLLLLFYSNIFPITLRRKNGRKDLGLVLGLCGIFKK